MYTVMVDCNSLLIKVSATLHFKISYPCQHGVSQTQDALPVDPGEEEAFGGQDDSDVDDEGPVGAVGDGDAVDAQFTFPVSLRVSDSHSPAN